MISQDDMVLIGGREGVSECDEIELEGIPVAYRNRLARWPNPVTATHPLTSSRPPAVPQARSPLSLRPPVPLPPQVRPPIPGPHLHRLVGALAVLAVDAVHQPQHAAVQLRNVATRGARRVGDLHGQGRRSRRGSRWGAGESRGHLTAAVGSCCVTAAQPARSPGPRPRFSCARPCRAHRAHHIPTVGPKTHTHTHTHAHAHAHMRPPPYAHLHQHQLPPPLGVCVQQPLQRQQLELNTLPGAEV